MIVATDNLSKEYDGVYRVQDLDIQIKEGDIYGFLGPNGAGKSTTINIICSIIKKDSGMVKVDGLDIDSHVEDIKKITGIVFQQSVLDERLSVKDNLKCRAALYGITGEKFRSTFDFVTNVLSLEDIISRPYGKLSGGQKRRVDIARGLLNEPKLLILDEPTTGLDPQTRKSVWSVIDKLRSERDMTVFLTTHYMEEAGGADDVIILDSGLVAASGTPVELKNRYSGTYIKIYSEGEGIESKVRALFPQAEYVNNCYRVKISSSEDIKKWVNSCPKDMEDYEIIKGEMDDVFLNVTGKTLAGGGL